MADHIITLSELEEAAMLQFVEEEINPTSAEPFADADAYMQAQARILIARVVQVFNDKDRAKFIALYDTATLEERAAARAALPQPPPPPPPPPDPEPEIEDGLVVSRG